MVVGAGLSVFAFFHAQAVESANAKNSLELAATWSARDIQNGIVDASVPVEALADFIGSQAKIDPAEFKGFVVTARGNDPVYRLGWAPVIPAAQRAAFEAEARADGLAGFTISDRGPGGELHPAAERPLYAPIRLGERFDGFSQEVGFDLMSDPARKAAVEQVIRDDHPIASELTMDTFGTRTLPSLTLVWPIHRTVIVPPGADLVALGNNGLVVGLYNITGLADFAIESTPPIAAGIGLFIDHDHPAPGDRPIGHFPPDSADFQLSPSALATTPAGALRVIRTFEQFGRRWTLVYDFPAGAVDRLRTSAPLAYLGMGLLLTLALCFYAMAEEYRRHIVEALVEQRTRDLARSQARLAGITSSIYEGVIVVGTDGHVLFINPSARQQLGVAEGVTGAPLDHLFVLGRGGAEIRFAEGPFHQVIGTGETVTDDDALFVLRDGTRLPVAFACAGLEEGGQFAATLSFRSTEMLKKAQAEALQASRLASVGQLAAGIAHEINTPVQYVGDNLRFIQESLAAMGKAIAALAGVSRNAGPEADEQVKRVYAENDLGYLLGELPAAVTQSLEGVDRVSRIVRSMKEFSHPGTTAKVATDLNRSIASTITVSTNEWKHVARVETDLAPDLPLVLCFAAEINQVLLNLIVNASHAIESAGRGSMGLIRISTRRDGDCAEIRVSDSGIGVPATIREQIFDPFFTTKTVGRGTGQGLAIALDVVVNKHHGQLSLGESDLPGATFVVRLPITEETADPTHAEKP